MAVLTIPNTFVAGTPALASEVNANFAQIVSWSSGLDQDNMATFTGDLAFTIANGNAIVIQNNGNDESIKITQGALLGAGKASILITDSQTQTASGAAELKMVLASGATIPAIHVLHGATDTLKLTRDYLRLEVLLKPPVKTTLQRNALSSPEEGSVIYNSTTQTLEVKNNTQWQGIGNPVGSMIMFAGSAAPFGWLLCQGQEISQVTYSELYSIVGSSFNTGGEAVGNFRLPDMRRRVPMGAGGSVPAGAPVTANTVGSSGGSETITLSLTQIPSHNHGGNTSSTAVPYQQFTGSGVTVTYNAFNVNTVTSGNTTLTFGSIPNSDHSHSIPSEGGGSAHSNTQPSLVVNYIIKY